MPQPLRFWDRPDVNAWLPTVQDLDDEPDASEFQNHPRLQLGNAPPLRHDPQAPQLLVADRPDPLQGPDLVAALGDYIKRRGTRPTSPIRQAGYFPYLGRVLQGAVDPSAALQASALER